MSACPPHPPNVPAPLEELRWRTWTGIIALPALLLGALMVTYWVDLPSYDQWTAMAPLVEKLAAGTLGLDDVLALHNEHRLLVPRLAFLPLAQLTHWDTRAEMVLSWLTLVGIAANWWNLLRATGWRASRETHALFAAIAVLVFHTLQFENLLLGFQFHFILPIYFATAGLWLARAGSGVRAYVGAGAMAMAATFSSAHGLLCWPLFAPVLGAQRGRISWWVGYLCAGALCVALYFRGYRNSVQSPEFPGVGGILAHVLAYLGAPFADGSLMPIVPQAQVVGAVLLALFAVAAAAVWHGRRDEERTANAMPWLMAAVFAIDSALLTAWGRAFQGAAQAFETRYATYAIILPIALLPLGLLYGSRSRRGWILGGAFVLVLLQVTAQSVRLPLWAQHRQQRLMCRAIAEAQAFDPGGKLARYVSIAPLQLRERVENLARAGYLRVSPLTADTLAAIGSPTAPQATPAGRLRGGADGMELGGWAMLPERGEPADLVLLSYDDAKGKPVPFHATLARLQSREAVMATASFDFAMCGWRAHLGALDFPESARAVRAWAYDSAARRAWPLAGETVVRRD